MRLMLGTSLHSEGTGLVVRVERLEKLDNNSLVRVGTPAPHITTTHIQAHTLMICPYTLGAHTWFGDGSLVDYERAVLVSHEDGLELLHL